MKLTDTDALRKAVRDDPEIDGLTYARVMRHIIEAKREDAVPVVHAHWKEWWPPKHMIMTGEEMLYVCSACTAKYSDIEGKRYCPFCGAKMDEEKEDTCEQDSL